jgi:hypothetical protein
MFAAQSTAVAERRVTVAATLIFAAHVLLPIGNALPPLHLGPIPVHLPMLLYPPFVFAACRLWPVDHHFRTGVVAFTGLLLTASISLVYSGREQGIYEWLLDIFRLLGGFAVAWVLVARLPPRTLARVLSAVLITAALVGVVERLNNRPMWPWADWYSGWFVRAGTVQEFGDLPGTFRVWGTVGNPITYCCLLMLGLPWVAEIRGSGQRWASIFLLCVSAVLTLSRTVILFGLPYLIYCALVLSRAGLRRNAVRLLITVLLSLAVIFTFYDPIRQLWDLRLAAESVSDAEGVSSRGAILELALGAFFSDPNPIVWLFGYGQGFGAEIARKVLPFLDTVDNEYLALLLQSGLLGLGLWLAFWATFLFRAVAASRWRSFHFWAVIGYLLCGLSFEIHRYFALDLLAFCSLARISCKSCEARWHADEWRTG